MKSETRLHWEEWLRVATLCLLIGFLIGMFVTMSGCRTLPPLPEEANGKQWQVIPHEKLSPCPPDEIRKFNYDGEYFESHDGCEEDVKLKWPDENDNARRTGIHAWELFGEE